MTTALFAAIRTAGGLLAPSGRVARTSLAYALIAIAVAIPVAVGLAAFRVAPLELPAALEVGPDARTDGERAIAFASSRLATTPDDPHALGLLASGYLQRVRENADPTYYSKAEALLARAQRALPADPDLLIVQGSLALARHDFGHALEIAESAVVRAPARPAAWGILVDALVELGRYDEAVMAAQEMIDLRPDLASLSRVSYLRELHGDLIGAIAAMRQAVDAGALISEATTWSQVQLGNLYFAQGDLETAVREYKHAQLRIAAYPPASAGLARVQAARGDFEGAARLYETAVARLPLPEYLAGLGDVYARLGDDRRAQAQYQLVEVTARLLTANGVRVDAELALFAVDHGSDPRIAVETLRAEYQQRPSVQIADALAWAEYRGADIRAAAAYSKVAMHLGSADPLLRYRAGVIAAAAGDTERGQRLLREVYATNPEFSVLYAPDLARRIGR